MIRFGSCLPVASCQTKNPLRPPSKKSVSFIFYIKWKISGERNHIALWRRCHKLSWGICLMRSFQNILMGRSLTIFDSLYRNIKKYKSTLKMHLLRMGCLVEEEFSKPRKPSGKWPQYVLLFHMWAMVRVPTCWPSSWGTPTILLCCSPLLRKRHWKEAI